MKKITYSNKSVFKLLFVLFTISVQYNAKAQTPGQIFDAATPTVNTLDPDGDGWITTTGAAFISNDQDESEIPYDAIPQVSLEPSGDLSTGSSCGPTDIVDDPSSGTDGSYYYILDPDSISNSGDELLLFRLRIASNPGNGAFGFSVLIDSDILFGPNDPNSVNGNPGFEYEIRLKSGGGAGVFIDNVDGSTNGTNITSFSINTNAQRSYALVQDISCSGAPVFYDFFVPLSSMGLNDTSNFRLIVATASSPGSVLGGSASDIGGTDDDNPLYSGDQDLIFEDVIAQQGDGLNIDTDGDGIKDNDDIDDDNDGISDLSEGYGANNPFGDEDGDGILNWKDTVDDGNGGDGSTTTYIDTNLDGISDVYDKDGDGIANHLDLDSDNDGINDVIEGGNTNLDTNGDGLINYLDFSFTDNNGNGQDDSSESTINPDTDGDKISDFLDLDSDNDGINDVLENGNSSLDTNGDGIVDGLDTDGDGIQDSVDSDNTGFGEGSTGSTVLIDTDGDSVPNYLDLDSDDDGVLDVIESGNGFADTNGDGVIDSDDTNGTDNDGDGISDVIDNDINNFGDSGDAGNSDDLSDSQDPFSGGSGMVPDSGVDNDGDGISDSLDDCDNVNGTIQFGLCDFTLSIQDYNFFEFSMYPNPANNIINIRFENSINDINVSIYDSLGKLVYNKETRLINSKCVLNVSNLNSGLYFVTINSEGKTMTKKLVKN